MSQTQNVNTTNLDFKSINQEVKMLADKMSDPNYLNFNQLGSNLTKDADHSVIDLYSMWAKAEFDKSQRFHWTVPVSDQTSKRLELDMIEFSKTFDVNIVQRKRGSKALGLSVQPVKIGKSRKGQRSRKARAPRQKPLLLDNFPMQTLLERNASRTALPESRTNSREDEKDKKCSDEESRLIMISSDDE